MARWLNWLERPVHTREVESSSLSLAIIKKITYKSQTIRPVIFLRSDGCFVGLSRVFNI